MFFGDCQLISAAGLWRGVVWRGKGGLFLPIL